MLEFTIKGEPASKANSRRLVTIKGRPAFIKSSKALNYEKAALYQLRAVTRGREALLKPCGVNIVIYYASNRPDLDESVILDVLQKAGVYKNDRLVHEKHIYHALDKLNPRAEIKVWELVDNDS